VFLKTLHVTPWSWVIVTQLVKKFSSSQELLDYDVKLVSYYHNPENLDLNLHSRENIKTRKKFHFFFLNSTVYYRDHNSPSLVPILSQINPVHTFPKIHPKFITTPRYSKWSLPSSLTIRFSGVVLGHRGNCFRISEELNRLLKE
jgi:hypothetical protein